ncbi:MAG: ATP-dependent hsl protease ATP-binding subunit HslU, partial [uncultured Gemmatimonadaceae bacterium]
AGRAAGAPRGRDRGRPADAPDVRHDGVERRARGVRELHGDAPGDDAEAQEEAHGQGLRGAPHPLRAGDREARRPGRHHRRRARARREDGDHLPRRDRQDRRRARAGGRAGRVARGRAARPPADRRGLQRADQVRDGEDRPRALHRGRRLPRREAQRPDPRAAGALPDPRRAQVAHRGRLRPHHDGARERAHQAVRGARRGRGRGARLHRRRRRGARAHRGHRERPDGEHRRAAAPHGDDHAARGRALRAPRPRHRDRARRRRARPRPAEGDRRGRGPAEVHPL